MRFESLVGHTIHRIEGAKEDSEEVTIFASGVLVTLNHHQDCCESVYVSQVDGDVRDLIGEEVRLAEEVQSGSCESSGTDEYGRPRCGHESCTWTFYKLRTHKGDVTIRWLGTSNGYYSESVNVEFKVLDIHEYAVLLESSNLELKGE